MFNRERRPPMVTCVDLALLLGGFAGCYGLIRLCAHL
jgi:hypothetical protein